MTRGKPWTAAPLNAATCKWGKIEEASHSIGDEQMEDNFKHLHN